MNESCIEGVKDSVKEEFVSYLIESHHEAPFEDAETIILQEFNSYDENEPNSGRDRTKYYIVENNHEYKVSRGTYTIETHESPTWHICYFVGQAHKPMTQNIFYIKMKDIFSGEMILFNPSNKFKRIRLDSLIMHDKVLKLKFKCLLSLFDSQNMNYSYDMNGGRKNIKKKHRKKSKKSRKNVHKNKKRNHLSKKKKRTKRRTRK